MTRFVNTSTPRAQRQLGDVAIDFVGPSYELSRKKADTQRLINMATTQVESGNSGKSSVFLQSISGLNMFSDYVPPDPGGDPYFAQVGYLLHFDNPLTPQVYTDVKGNLWARQTPGVVSRMGISTEAKYGAGGLYVSTGTGISSDYTITANLLGGDRPVTTDNVFTMEAWLLWTGHVDSRIGVGRVLTTTGAVMCGIEFFTANLLSFNAQLASPVQMHFAPPLNRWTFLAMTYDGTTLRGFVDGLMVASQVIAPGAHHIIRAYQLGSVASGNNFAPTAYVDDARFTFDVCRYSANFTPPTQPFLDF